VLQALKKRGGLRDDELAYDRVVFNFPHVGLGIKDQARARGRVASAAWRRWDAFPTAWRRGPRSP
jgi:hypothetical protein